MTHKGDKCLGKRLDANVHWLLTRGNRLKIMKSAIGRKVDSGNCGRVGAWSTRLPKLRRRLAKGSAEGSSKRFMRFVTGLKSDVRHGQIAEFQAVGGSLQA